jgi:hypothetical protein
MDQPPRTFWQIWNMSFGFLASGNSLTLPLVRATHPPQK